MSGSEKPQGSDGARTELGRTRLPELQVLPWTPLIGHLLYGGGH